MDQWSLQTRKAGTQRSKRLQIGDCAQTEQSCPVTHANVRGKKNIITQTASAALSWQTTAPILLLAVQPVDTTVNLKSGEEEKDTFGRDAGFPLGPEAVPARHYCLSQRSQREAWRHYWESRRRRGPVDCDNHEKGFFFKLVLTSMARLHESTKKQIEQITRQTIYWKF